jgi:hypothetical protein
LRCSPHLRCWRSNRALLQAEDIVSLRRNVAAHASPRLCVTQRTESVALLIRSSALSDVGRHLHSQNELSIRLSLSSRLATDFSALAPAQRAGAQRLSALARLRHANCIERCPLSRVTRKTFAQTSRMPTQSPGKYAGQDNGWVFALIVPTVMEFNKSIVDYPASSASPEVPQPTGGPTFNDRTTRCRCWI